MNVLAPPPDATVSGADPTRSVFVSAHAGSGKTRLLIDRLLRLMLAGAEPGRILCLTYTRAAAAEMATRLAARLGEWVTLPDPRLDEALHALGETPSPERRALARALFARVLDLPGGMRIETIHAFCASVLRRFPIEADLSPHFTLTDEAEARACLTELREALLPQADAAAIAEVASCVKLNELGRLIAELMTRPDRLAALAALAPAARLARLCAALGIETADEAALIAGAVRLPDEAGFRAALERCRIGASDTMRRTLDEALGWLKRPPQPPARDWSVWRRLMLTKAGEPLNHKAYATKHLLEENPDLAATLSAEQARVAAAEDARRAACLARRTEALLALATPLHTAQAERKTRGAALDYPDLIAHTRRLLADPGTAWVMFKLDGGLDHLLLDEVQDNSAEQWQLIDSLTAEFFAGEGASSSPRTVFAVGDRKQSIFAFQGADPDGFERQRETLAAVAAAARHPFERVGLEMSRRSTAPVLALVDAVFNDEKAALGVTEPGTLRHRCGRPGHAGRVELWPLPKPADAPEPDPWAAQQDWQPTVSALEILAERIVAEIQSLTGGDRLASENRRIEPGDILILIRRRSALDRSLARRLKEKGIAVTGQNEVTLTEQPAVADLIGLCRTLLLPEDDLALAETLTSPLGGLTDESLLALAAARGPRRLWDTLRARAAERPDWQAALDRLTALRTRADFDEPHALLAHALGPLGGRARLLARLGEEAAEPIDELLALALDHAARHPPSLEGFLHWLNAADTKIRRPSETAARSVRILTVHGAKGLEAPIVVLPDTMYQPRQRDRLVWCGDPPMPIWVPAKDESCGATTEARDAARAREQAEENRLLYVALTRARDRLIVCGLPPGRNKQPENTWYSAIERGFARLPDVQIEPFSVSNDWSGETRVLETPQTAPPAKPNRNERAGAVPPPPFLGAAPDWRPAPLPAEPALPEPLAPSRPEGVELGPVPPSRSPLARAGETPVGRGLLAHTLLQHLPDLPQPQRETAAQRLIAAASPAPEDAQRLATQVLAVLDAPDLAPLFGPGSRAEQRIAGRIADRLVSGQVDRLAILPDRVLIADYKTGRRPPATAADVPVLYLRQMASYRAVLAALFPDRPVECVLIWTETCTPMGLDPALLDAHAPA